MKLKSLISTRPRARFHPTRAFTMIEIAISLAVIGFALVAILGVLPLGLDVQRENREETIINQDATMLMEAIRNGAQGVDDLTNYVVSITNYVTEYVTDGRPLSRVYGYTHTNSSTARPFPLTSGYRIIGLLSTPKYMPFSRGKSSGVVSNHLVATIRSLSGSAAEKFPQTNQSLRELAFSYKLFPEIVPYSAYDPSWVNFGDPAIRGNTNEIAARSNYWMYARNMQTNLHDVRLRFRWPLLPTGKTGNGWQSYRTMASGTFLATNEFGYPQTPEYRLYFLQPRTYVKAP
jgi:type II secretory pathway pseudopilin PulG